MKRSAVRLAACAIAVVAMIAPPPAEKLKGFQLERRPELTRVSAPPLAGRHCAGDIGGPVSPASR